MRSFTFSEGTSNKFWNIDLQGKQFTVTFGKVGTNGQTQVKAFADDAAAKKEHDKLVAEKVKKGYTETSAAPPRLATPPLRRWRRPRPPPRRPPAPAPAASGKRTFEFSDASSHKFWNIERAGVGAHDHLRPHRLGGADAGEVVRRRGEGGQGVRQARRREDRQGLPRDDAVGQGRSRRISARRWRWPWSRTPTTSPRTWPTPTTSRSRATRAAS